MADLKMRPRFTVDVVSDVETVVQALRKRTGNTDRPLEETCAPPGASAERRVRAWGARR